MKSPAMSGSTRTIWIMAHMNANMTPDPALMNLQMQH